MQTLKLHVLVQMNKGKKMLTLFKHFLNWSKFFVLLGKTRARSFQIQAERFFSIQQIPQKVRTLVSIGTTFDSTPCQI